MALVLNGSGNGSINNLSLSANTGTILDSANNTFFMHDMWRLPSTLTGHNAVITTWQRVAEASFAQIGTGMTHSSGIFTFPTTGIYLVLCQIEWYLLSVDGLAAVTLEVTQDNSSYDDYLRIVGGSETTVDNFISTFAQAMIDVTDTSQVKLKFTSGNVASDSKIVGNTTIGHTQIYFTRIGDT